MKLLIEMRLIKWMAFLSPTSQITEGDRNLLTISMANVVLCELMRLKKNVCKKTQLIQIVEH